LSIDRIERCDRIAHHDQTARHPLELVITQAAIFGAAIAINRRERGSVMQRLTQGRRGDRVHECR